MAAGKSCADFNSKIASFSSFRVLPLIILKGPLRGLRKSRKGSAIALSEAILRNWPSAILTKFSSYIGHFKVCALLVVIKINEFVFFICVYQSVRYRSPYAFPMKGKPWRNIHEVRQLQVR